VSAAPIRVAVWSGPRNISTALMRSWGSRADTVVVDEPLYAHYLLHTGLEHPGREEVIARHETDWRRVVDALDAPLPDGRRIQYEKQMSHHLLPHIGRDWIARRRNVLLIRDPLEVLLSYSRVIERPRLEDTGLPGQLELARWLEQETGKPPAVFDAKRILLEPEASLRAMCAAVDVPWDSAMLQWQPGRRATDGVWAPHWYAAVERSSRFEPYRPPTERLDPALEPVLEEARTLYAELAAIGSNERPHRRRETPDGARRARSP